MHPFYFDIFTLFQVFVFFYSIFCYVAFRCGLEFPAVIAARV